MHHPRLLPEPCPTASPCLEASLIVVKHLSEPLLVYTPVKRRELSIFSKWENVPKMQHICQKIQSVAYIRR